MKYDTARPYLAACVILRRDGKIAFVLRSHTSWMNGHYGLPGGKVEKGESGMQAALREAKEETGVIIKPADLRPALVCHRKTSDDSDAWIDIVFEADTWQGEAFNAEPNRHSELAWFAPDALPSNIVPVTAFVIAEIAAGRHYAEGGWEEA